MRLRGKKKRGTAPESAATRRPMDGRAAVCAVEATVGDALALARDLFGIDAPREASAAALVRVGDARDVLHWASGWSASGLRAAAFVGAAEGALAHLRAAAGAHLPLVVHLACRGARGHAVALAGGHDDYHAAAASGAILLFARNAQETADLALVARRVAEHALLPVVVAQDFPRTTHGAYPLVVPDPEFARAYVGAAGDEIEAPTPAQAVLLGATRRRVPRWVDPDRPAGWGAHQDREAFAAAAAAQRTFFADHAASILDEAMRAFSEQSERPYGRLCAYCMEGAEVVVVSQGALSEAVEDVVDRLRAQRVKAGALGVTALRPFPGAELARALAACRALTVLERVDEPLGEDPPLAREVRAAFADAAGRDPERPSINVGVCPPGGAIPSSAHVEAAFRNMLAGKDARARFYVGLASARDTRRFPHLESLRHRLRRDYPSLDALALAPSPPAADGPATPSVEIHGVASHGVTVAAGLFARALARAGSVQARTFPRDAVVPLVKTARVVLWHGDGAPPKAPPEPPAALLATGEALFETLPDAEIARAGTVIVATRHEPASFARAASRRAAAWVRARALQVRVLDAGVVAAGTASNPSHADQLTLWALLGAYASNLRLDRDALVAAIRAVVAEELGGAHYLVDDVARAFAGGAEAAREVEWPGDEAHVPESEPDAPWTLAGARDDEGDAFDAARFWRSVGFLYEKGRPEEALIDPYLASGIIPAASGAARDLSSLRHVLPRWLPENCTGCGACWAHCPDAALPPSIQRVEALLEAAMARCEADGPLVQMRRAAKHLAKQAQRIAAAGTPQPLTRLDGLLDDAFAQLRSKLTLEESAGAALEAEFARVRDVVAEFPVARTETFFHAVEAGAKGTGELLSITINPLACKACGLCVAVCPDAAMELAPQTEERLAEARRTWRFQVSLPRVAAGSVARHLRDDDPAGHVHRLLDKNAYHTIVGGDAAVPASAVKTALHLVTAAVESAARPDFDAHERKLGALVEGLEAAIQSELAGALTVNDFEDFASRLGRMDRDGFTVASLLGEAGAEQRVDAEKIQRCARLAERLRALRRRYADGAEARARMVLVIENGETTWAGVYPYNPLVAPWLARPAGAGAATAEAIFDGLARRAAEEAADARRARLEIDGAYDARAQEAELRALEAADLTDEERAALPTVVLFLRDAAGAREAAARWGAAGKPIVAAVIDTEGPVGDARDRALAEFAAAGPPLTVLQSGVGHPGHLLRGVAQAVSRRRGALVRVYAPDPVAHGIAPERVAEQARLAGESRAVPLFAYDPRSRTVDIVGNPALDADWADRVLTFDDPSGQRREVRAPLTPADWAVREGRFEGEFEVRAMGDSGGDLSPLSAFLDLGPAGRAAASPFVHLRDVRGRLFLAVASPRLVRMAESARDGWRRLRALAAPASAGEAAAIAPATAPPQPAPEVAEAAGAHAQMVERLTLLSGLGNDPEYFKRSLREFLIERRRAQAAEEPAPGPDGA
ncbi:MAG: 4Fe-4S binding protein [Candidatus Krumholzibacteria bacterium]|nr:4Fe-4S binding protein [Candidatus Krumholzibacteria bacterium]